MGSKGVEGAGAWDQFEANKRLYNVRSSYDENLYTKRLDMSTLTLEQQKRAERIAREIEGSVSSNIHLRTERGQALEEEVDEEDMHSGVMRQSSEKQQQQQQQPSAASSSEQREWSRGKPLSTTTSSSSPASSSAAVPSKQSGWGTKTITTPSSSAATRGEGKESKGAVSSPPPGLASLNPSSSPPKVEAYHCLYTVYCNPTYDTPYLCIIIY